MLSGRKFSRRDSRILSPDHIVWLDLEMTGLNPNKDKILEIACIITDSNLYVVEEGPNLVIHQEDEVLENMDDWCKAVHEESGLLKAVKESEITVEKACHLYLSFLRFSNIPQGECPLAGNTVYMDRLFLRKYMPSLDQYFHYRTIDVSSVKELAKRWYPGVFGKMPKKMLHHRALADIKESIEELKFYRQNIFK
ncbi:unnamed protein product [Gordionus sp. m RMFG-2023]